MGQAKLAQMGQFYVAVYSIVGSDMDVAQLHDGESHAALSIIPRGTIAIWFVPLSMFGVVLFSVGSLFYPQRGIGT